MAEIRRIRVDEAPLVRQLVSVSIEELERRYPEDQIGISERGLTNLETRFRLGAVHEDELTLVAVEGQEIVGYISTSLSRGRALPGIGGEVDQLWVRAGPARSALERRLAQAAVNWLRERGAGAIFRFEDARHPTREPWESLGFEPDVIRFSLYE